MSNSTQIISWKLLRSSFQPHCSHMQWDREQFEAFQEDDTPLLRFYSFQAPTITIGRLEVQQGHRIPSHVPIDVRPTGGRAVYHGSKDLCYSVMAPCWNSQVGGSLLESYLKISRILQAAFLALGKNVELAPHRIPTQKAKHCFSSPSYAELLLHDKKIAGGAQCRRQNVFLQQGVILLDVDPEWECLSPEWRGEGMAGLNYENEQYISRPQLEAAIIKSFEACGIGWLEYDFHNGK